MFSWNKGTGAMITVLKQLQYTSLHTCKPQNWKQWQEIIFGPLVRLLFDEKTQDRVGPFES